MRSNKAPQLLITIVACLTLTSCALPAPRWIPRYTRPAPYQRVHVVLKGETLYTISRRYGLPVEAIERTNGLQDPNNIKVGQRLRIPRRNALARLHRAPRARNGVRPARTTRPSEPLLWPVRGPVTNRFSEDAANPHKGIDIAAPSGTQVRAADAGTVLFSGVGPEGYGKMVIIKHRSRFVTVYARNRANLVRVGDKVVRGHHIAYVGSNGNAKDPFLHFEVRIENDSLDPMTALPR